MGADQIRSSIYTCARRVSGTATSSTKTGGLLRNRLERCRGRKGKRVAGRAVVAARCMMRGQMVSGCYLGERLAQERAVRTVALQDRLPRRQGSFDLEPAAVTDLVQGRPNPGVIHPALA